jgi:CheY-like chemotaxis protein
VSGTIHGTAYDARQMAAPDPVRVMVIDDQADVRFLVGLILGDEGDIEVVAEAEGAEAALATVLETAPDVALLDARMPIMDGFELAPRLLERAPGLRIALLTSLVDDVIEERAREAGAHACASKADFDALPDLVRRLAAR